MTVQACIVGLVTSFFGGWCCGEFLKVIDRVFGEWGF